MNEMKDSAEIESLQADNGKLRRQLAALRERLDEAVKAAALWEERAREVLVAGETLSKGIDTADECIAELTRQRDEAQRRLKVLQDSAAEARDVCLCPMSNVLASERLRAKAFAILDLALSSDSSCEATSNE